jgi:hypothetical protein
VDGRKSLEGEDLSGLSVGAKCVSEGRNWVLSLVGMEWDGMEWDGMMGLMELGLMKEEEDDLRWESGMARMKCWGGSCFDCSLFKHNLLSLDNAMHFISP